MLPRNVSEPSSDAGEVVRNLPGAKATVKIPKSSSCEECSHKPFCSPFGTEHMLIEARNPIQASPGQRVQVDFSAETPGKAILVLCIIPLAALLAGAFLGNALDPFGNKDASGAVLSLAGVALAFAGIRAYTRKRAAGDESKEPRIVKLLE
jgi:positive regulator of sigma E activity